MSIQLMGFGMGQQVMPQKSSLQSPDNKQEDFASTLKKSEKKQEAQSKPKEKTKVDSKKDHKTSSNEVETPSEVEGKKEDTKVEATNEKETVEIEEVSGEDKQLFEKEIEKIMNELAGLLGITMDELEQMLTTLQIGISDLLQGDNLQQLIMEVHQVEEQIDLLGIPEVASQVQAVKAVLEEFEVTIAPLIKEQSFSDMLDEMQLEEPVDTVVEVAMNTEDIIDQVGIANVQDARNEKKVLPDSKAASENQASEVDMVETETAAKVTIENPSSDQLSQGKEQFTQEQNSSANQFMDNLTQSMADVLQSQNSTISEVEETVVESNKVVSPRVVIDQIIEKIKVSTIENETKMNIQLKPEHLGKLNMEVISKQGVMTARFTVENDKTKEIIEQNIQSLKESLEDQGLVIEQLEVTVGQNQSEDTQAYSGPKPSKNVSDIIDSIMNEEIEEDIASDNVFENDANEIDFTA